MKQSMLSLDRFVCVTYGKARDDVGSIVIARMQLCLENEAIPKSPNERPFGLMFLWPKIMKQIAIPVRSIYYNLSEYFHIGHNTPII